MSRQSTVPAAAWLVLMACPCGLPEARGQAGDPWQSIRHKMVDDVVIANGVTNKRVLQAMRDTPRHEFVIRGDRPRAYFDMAIAIGEGQTISPPFIVAYMTEQLDPQPTDKVLEIGTGSGYQAAVLSPLVKEVYTIEIVPELGRRADRTLLRLGYKNIHRQIGDGFKGWQRHAPFDKIIVTCSPEKVPEPLVRQLREGGRMVIPIGERYHQTMVLLKKQNGKLVTEALRPTMFVPMTGQAEQARQIKPDPLNPQIINGGFEEMVGDTQVPITWYYQRQLKLVTDERAPRGTHYVTITNQEAGRHSGALQAFPVDGRKVKLLEVSATVRTKDARPGRNQGELPKVSVSFYDDQRKPTGQVWIGPWHGTFDWERKTREVPVPARAREAFVRIGLHGGTGEMSIDDVTIQAVRPRRAAQQ